MKKTWTLTKDKETKGTYRFQNNDAFGSGRPISIYVPKSMIEQSVTQIKVTLEWV